MKRSEVRAFVKSGVDAIQQTISFNNGRITEFNSERSNDYPYVWLVTPSATTNYSTTNAPQDDWNIELHIAKKDKIDSLPEVYESIIDECDEIARKLMNQYRNALSSGSLIEIVSADRNPFIHKHADDTTGVILTFTLTGPDNATFC